MSFLLQNYKFV